MSTIAITSQLLIKAATTIEEEADALHHSCTVGLKSWQCGGCSPKKGEHCASRRRYDDMARLAKQLRKQLKTA